LTELGEQDDYLIESYESLQLEHLIAKQELENLQRGNSKRESLSLAIRNYHSGQGEWDESRIETSDVFLTDIDVFNYDQKQGNEHTEELITIARRSVYAVIAILRGRHEMAHS
jgi:hypothetical protein